MPIYTPQTQLENGRPIWEYDVQVSFDGAGAAWTTAERCTFADTDAGRVICDDGLGTVREFNLPVRLTHRRSLERNPLPRPDVCPACGRPPDAVAGSS